jgi:hypothetical protein
MLEVSLASISFTPQTKNEVSQKETITQKHQIQELTSKYFLPHLKKVDKT